MDRDSVALCVDHYDHHEQVGCGVRPDDEPAVWVFSGVFDCQRMVDGVEDDPLGDAMCARRFVNLQLL
jgi:hypothetical protein